MFFPPCCENNTVCYCCPPPCATRSSYLKPFKLVLYTTCHTKKQRRKMHQRYPCTSRHLVFTQIAKEEDKAEQQMENLQGHTEKPNLTQALPVYASPLPPAHTHVGLWIRTWHLLCLHIAWWQPRGTHCKQLPLATELDFLPSLNSASTAGWPCRGARAHMLAKLWGPQYARLIFSRSWGTLIMIVLWGCRFCLWVSCKTGLGNHIPNSLDWRWLR